jgi:MFS family permease
LKFINFNRLKNKINDMLMPKIDERSFYPWLVVALLWGVALLNYMDRQMLSTMKPAIMVDIAELEKAENFGRLMAVFLWIYGLMSPMAGLIADRINRKWLIIGSLGVWSFVTLTMGYATSFGQLFVLRAIMGISEALYMPAGLSLIADYHRGNTRSLAIGLHMTGIYFGQALGGFGATVASSWSWQAAFHSFGLIGITYSLVLIFFLSEKRVEGSQAVGNNKLLGNPVLFCCPQLPRMGCKKLAPDTFFRDTRDRDVQSWSFMHHYCFNVFICRSHCRWPSC